MHLQTTENSRQHLLLRTDILQKTVVGCPWLLNQCQMHKGTGPSYLLQRHLGHASPLLAIFLLFSPEVWLVSYLFFSFQIWYMRKWMFTSIGQSKHMRVTSFNISRVSAWTELSFTFSGGCRPSLVYLYMISPMRSWTHAFTGSWTLALAGRTDPQKPFNDYSQLSLRGTPLKPVLSVRLREMSVL